MSLTPRQRILLEELSSRELTPEQQKIVAELRRRDTQSKTSEQPRFANEAERRRYIASQAGRVIGGKERGLMADELATATESGLNTFTFGGADYLRAIPGAFVGGPGRSAPNPVAGYRETVEFLRGRREGQQEANPASALVGNIAGGAAGGTAALRALSKAPKAVQAVAAPLAVTQGQPLANVARLTASSGITSGVQGTLETGSLEEGGEAAIYGAVGGPVMGRLMEEVGGLGKYLAPKVAGLASRALGNSPVPSNSAARSAIERVGSRAQSSSPEDLRRLRQEAADFYEREGRGATLTELLAPEEAAEFGAGLRNRPPAQQQLSNAVRGESQRRQREMADNLSDALPFNNTKVDIRLDQKEAGNAFFEEFGKKEIKITDDFANTVLSQVGDPRGRVPKDAIGDVLTLRELEDMRTSIPRADGGGALRSKIAKYMQDQFEPHRDYLREYHLAHEMREGAQYGQDNILRPDDPNAEVIARVNSVRYPENDVDKSFLEGIRTGGRNRIVGEAGEGGGNALRLARDLADNRNLYERAKTTYGKEAANRLREVGQREAKSAENIQNILRSMKPQLGEDTEKQITELIYDGAAATAIGGGGALWGGIMQRVTQVLAPLSDRQSKELADMLVNPDRLEEALGYMDSLQLPGEVKQGLVQLTPFVTGAIFGPAFADGTEADINVDSAMRPPPPWLRR